MTMRSRADTNRDGKTRHDRDLPVGPVSGEVTVFDDPWESQSTAPTPGPVEGAVEIDANEADATTEPTGHNALSTSASGRADWTLPTIIAVAFVTLVLTLAVSRVAAEFARLLAMSSVMAGIYLAAFSAVVVSASLLAGRSWRRYQRIKQVTKLQKTVGEHATSGPSRFKESRRVRHELEAYLHNLEQHASGRTRECINNLRCQFSNYSDDGTRDIEEFEMHLLRALDEEADAIIDRRSAQVAVATALASHSFDALIVIWQAVRLIEQIAQLYAGRPGVWGTARLFRRAMAMVVFAEIAELATEALAEAAARRALATVGGRLAEGMANGFLMIRFGEAVKQQCRPVPCPRPDSGSFSRLSEAFMSRFNSSNSANSAPV